MEQKIIKKIIKYKKKVASGDGLNLKQQKEILDEISARPYRFTIESRLDQPIDFYLPLREHITHTQTMQVELDDGTTLTFNIKGLIAKNSK